MRAAGRKWKSFPKSSLSARIASLDSPPRGCPTACCGDGARGDRAEALAKAGIPLRRSSALFCYGCPAACCGELHLDIPYALLAFHPQFFFRDLPVTPRGQALRCKEIAEEEGLRRVRIGNLHLL